MDQATQSLPHITAAIITLARYFAKQAVKAEWHKQGLRWQYLDASELAKAADAYLSEHRDELIDRARSQLSSDAQKSKT
jgi:hypothetical protein